MVDVVVGEVEARKRNERRNRQQWARVLKISALCRTVVVEQKQRPAVSPRGLCPLRPQELVGILLLILLFRRR